MLNLLLLIALVHGNSAVGLLSTGRLRPQEPSSAGMQNHIQPTQRGTALTIRSSRVVKCFVDKLSLPESRQKLQPQSTANWSGTAAIVGLLGCLLEAHAFPGAAHASPGGDTFSTADANLLTIYMSLLTTAPIPTKAGTAAVLCAMGDALAQLKEQQVKREQQIKDGSLGTPRNGIAQALRSFDEKRSLSFAIFGAIYTGAFQHSLFQWLVEHFHGTYLAGSGVPVDQELLAAMERTFANQLVCIPLLYYPTYFTITGALAGLSFAEGLQRAKTLYGPLMKRNLAFWLPVQFAQFAAVPTDLQVPYVCVAGLVWNAILSAASGRAASPRPQPQTVAAQVVLRSRGRN